MSAGIDDYEFKGTIGSGSTGTVYLAHQTELDRDVAIKELAPELAADPAFVKRFRAEARIMAQLNSGNCVRIYDFLQADDEAYLVSEFIDGASLREVVQSVGRLRPEQSLGVLKGALMGLSRAHAMGLVHRDVKPENVLVDQDGVSKLADFGQAVAVGEAELDSMPTGTAVYMSPEQVRGRKLDHRTDIYSCGVMLFELLCGRPPFVADGARAVMRMHAVEAAPKAADINPDLPEGISVMLKKALAKTPAARQQSADEFLTELEATAVAAFGEDWEERSSIKKLVLALLPGVALAGAGISGIGMVVGAGSIAALLVAGTIYGLSRNAGTNSVQAREVAANTPPAVDIIRIEKVDRQLVQQDGQVLSLQITNAPIASTGVVAAGTTESTPGSTGGNAGGSGGGGGVNPTGPGAGPPPPPPPPPASAQCTVVPGQNQLPQPLPGVLSGACSTVNGVVGGLTGGPLPLPGPLKPAPIAPLGL
ncbi:MAG: serine/threonine-protein kinase [Candidatus Dormiibacterota bacterium]